MQKNVRKLEGEGQYMVLSASEKGLWHYVDVLEPFCDCKGFEHRGGCRHLQQISNLERGPQEWPERLPELLTTCYSMRALARADVVKVRVTLGAPKFHLPYEIDATVSELAPTGSMFRLKERSSFEAVYRRHLEVVGVYTIAQRLAEVGAHFGWKPLALLCFEDLTKAGLYCHRRVFADWWHEHTGVVIPEIFYPEHLLRVYGKPGEKHEENIAEEQETLF